jgi:hypothetical protein
VRHILAFLHVCALQDELKSDWLNAPVAWQMWFQDPATSDTEGITD